MIEIVLIGVNHRTASLELRERVAFRADQVACAAAGLLKRGLLAEAAVLSTCNRSEIYGVSACSAGLSGQNAETLDALADYFAEFHQVPVVDLQESLYRTRDMEAVRHLFRVTAGLDSMLLGEAEILGQVRQAYKVALENGSTGPVLNRLFQGALEVGKRVRTQTDIGARPMSVALAGVKLAEHIFGKLKGHQALILGAGTMAEQVAEHLRNRNIESVLVANRSREHGEELARQFGGEFVEWAALEKTLPVPEIVVCSVSAAEHVLTLPMLQRAMAARGNRGMFVIDLGMPRNVDPRAGDLYNVYLYNMDNLTEIVEQNKQARHNEIPRAEAIISKHVDKFQTWHTSLEVVELIHQLRDRLQHDREEFLRERLDQISHFSPEDRRRVAKLTEELVDRILQAPGERWKDSRALLENNVKDMHAVRRIFGLGHPSAPLPSTALGTSGTREKP